MLHSPARAAESRRRASFAAVSSASFSHPPAGAPVGAAHRTERLAAGGAWAPLALIAALLAGLLFAAFAHGAAGVTASARLQVAVAFVAALAAGFWLWSGTLRVAAPPLAVAGVALLAGFAVWSGITLGWSVARDHTWLELNRALTYVVVLCLAIAAGASHARSVELVVKGFTAVSTAVAVYALGQKLVPGLHVAGLFDLNQTGQLPRLQEPLGYWNALALFLGLGVPCALALTVDRHRSPAARLRSLTAASLMLVAGGLTYSRGGILALTLGLAAGFALSGARLRSLMWLALAAAAAAPPLAFGFTVHALSAVSVGLGDRELAGGELALVLGAALAALWIAGARLIRAERTTTIGRERARRIARLLGLLVGLLLACGVLAMTFSSRGLTGTVSHAWTSFTATRGANVYDPNNLISADSGNRWVWWKEAAGAFSDKPLGGWGAGSFPVVHLLYRRDSLLVQQPHNVPLQFLAETGIVGGLLGIGGFALLLAAGIGTVRRSRAGGQERILAAALLAGVVTYAVHAFYDWDWNIPGVTLPALVFAGVLAGAHGRRTHAQVSEPLAGTVMRALALGALTLVLCVFAASGALPSIAASKARSALVLAARSSSTDLASAQASAELASRLDPLSDAGLLAEATIAQHRGHLDEVRTYLTRATNRDPNDPRAWEYMASFSQRIGDTRGVAAASMRLVRLDPLRGPTLAAVRALAGAPPTDSATAHPLAGG